MSERQKVVYVAQPRRSENGSSSYPERRARTSSSADRARVAPLASIEDAITSPRRSLKGYDTLQRDSHRLGSSWGQIQKPTSETNISAFGQDSRSVQQGSGGRHLQAGSSSTLESATRNLARPRVLSPQSDGNSTWRGPQTAQSSLSRSADLLDDCTDQPQDDHFVRHYSFSTVSESQGSKAQSNLRWIRSLRRLRPGPKVTVPNGQESPTSPTSNSLTSPVSSPVERGKENSPVGMPIPGSEKQGVSRKSQEFSTGLPLSNSNNTYRDVVNENSRETRTTISSSSSGYVKQTVITNETTSVSKTRIHERRFNANNSFETSTELNMSSSSLSKSVEKYSDAEMSFQESRSKGNLSFSNDGSHTTRQSPPEVLDPLLCPDDLLQCEGLSKYTIVPADTPKINTHVGGRQKRFIPAVKQPTKKPPRYSSVDSQTSQAHMSYSKPEPRSLPLYSSQNAQSRTTNSNVCSQPNSYHNKAPSSSHSNQNNTSLDTSSSASDTSFQSCNSGNTLTFANYSPTVSVKNNKPSVIGAFDSTRNEAPKDSLRPTDTLDSTNATTPTMSQWKRNSLRLATLGYTSMSDLTNSVDNINLVVELEECANTNSSGNTSNTFRHGSEEMFHNISPENHVSAVTPQNPMYKAETLPIRPAEENIVIQCPNSNKCLTRDVASSRSPVNNQAVNRTQTSAPCFRLERETNSIIYTPAVNAFIPTKTAPVDIAKPTNYTSSSPVNQKTVEEKCRQRPDSKPPSGPRWQPHQRKPSPYVDSAKAITTKPLSSPQTYSSQQSPVTSSGPSHGNTMPKHSSPKSPTAESDADRESRIKRLSMRLATASISDLTCAVDDTDANVISPISSRSQKQEKPSLCRETRGRAQTWAHKAMAEYSPKSDEFHTPDSQRKHSRGASFSSGQNSSYGSYYSCQSVSANSSPMIGRVRDFLFSKEQNDSKSPSPTRRSSHGNPTDSPVSIYRDANSSFRTADETSSTTSGISSGRDSNKTIRIGRPWPYARPNNEEQWRNGRQSLSPPKSNNYGTVPAPGNRKMPKNANIIKQCYTGSAFEDEPSVLALLCSGSKSSHSKDHPSRAYNTIPLQKNNRPVPARTSPKSREPPMQRPTQSSRQEDTKSPTRQVQTTASVTRPGYLPLHSQPKPIPEISVAHPHISESQNFFGEDEQFSDDDSLDEHWSEMPRSPPSLGRPRRKVYAGFDSQPLPMDAFLSDSSSVYTTNTSCSSRAPSRSAENSYRGSDWSIEAKENLRTSTSLTYDSNRTTPTKDVFDSSLSVSSFNSAHDEFENKSGRERTRSTPSEHTRFLDTERTSYTDADDPSAFTSLKRQKARNLVLPLQPDVDMDKTPTSTPVDEKQSRELGQLYSIPGTDVAYRGQTAIKGRRSEATTPVNHPDKKAGAKLSAASSVTVGVGSGRSSALSKSKPKYFSSRDIFDLFLTPDRSRNPSLSTLTPLEKQAQKVCRAILCCNDEEEPKTVVTKEYLL